MAKEKMTATQDMIIYYQSLIKEYGNLNYSREDCKNQLRFMIKAIVDLTIQNGKLNIKDFGTLEIKKVKGAKASRMTFKMSPAMRKRYFPKDNNIKNAWLVNGNENFKEVSRKYAKQNDDNAIKESKE